MTQLAAYSWQGEAEAAPAVDSFVEPRRRTVLQPILLTLPVVLCACSFFAGGIPLATDLGFLLLTIFCAVFLFSELYRFSERFGIAGIVLYGGVLVWFCYDYFIHWFLASIPSWDMPYSQETVAKAAACYTLYILCMSIGIRMRIGQWAPRLIAKLPEPNNPNAYFWVMIITQIIGLVPYSIFTSEPFYMALYHQMVMGRTGGAAWTMGRTGNVNTSFGAYIAQLLQIGEGGAVLASFLLLFLKQNIVRNIICWVVWLLWLILEMGTGTRGETLFLFLPMVAFAFIRYHVTAQALLKKFSWKAYAAMLLGLLIIVTSIQIQARYRTEGFGNVDINEVSLTKLEGNSMFSEGLMGFMLVPESHGYFFDNPFEQVVLPLPNVVFWTIVAPMPRAVFPWKPIDPAMPWYNDVATGGSGAGRLEGTTISQGIVGYWFFRFGAIGVIEGGLFMGWLMGVCERTLMNNRGRPTAVLFSLGLATWMMRAYRDFSYPELTEFMVAMAGIVLIVLFVRPFFSGTPDYAGAEAMQGYDDAR